MDSKLVLICFLSIVFRLTVCRPSTPCRKTDIIFLLDSSGSVTETDFNHALRFIASFAKALPIGPDNVQIGVTVFSTSAREEIKLNAYRDSASLARAITSITYHYGSTHTEEALNYVKGQGFSRASGKRQAAQPVLIVITDGKSYDRPGTIAAADRIHRAGIITYAIAVGHSINYNELAKIATDLHHQFSTTSFGTLSTIQSELHIAACGEHTTSTVPTTTSTTTRDTTKFIWNINPDDCHDEVTNCGTYGPEMCEKYHDWAKVQCAKFCVYCKLPDTTTTVKPLVQGVSYIPSVQWLHVTEAPQQVNSSPVQFPGK